ncbi:MAG: rhomboid family intramembrane serine protease [Opitutaceae bacterium]|nr:rhomboid family intramembrane serine protease [Opitutaceae bacterium]
MLSDRPYMRDSYGRSSGFSALTWLIIIITGGFIVENIFLRWFGGEVGAQFFRIVTLSTDGITSGFVWSLVSHALLHDPQNLFHLGFTLLALFFFGRAVLTELSARRMITVFAVAVAVGGLFWLAANWHHQGRLYGASAGVSALVILFACLAPYQPITFFMVDIGMRAKHLAIGMLVIDVVGLFLVEIPGHGDSWFSMPHSAHLGGILVGWVYYRYVHLKDWTMHSGRPAIELPGWLRKTRKAKLPSPAYKVNLSNKDDMRAEIDRILDKINSDGFQSLTDEEKRRLDQARDQLSRR